MVQKLGDGQCICSEHWQKEFEAKEPVTGWIAGECDWCKRSEAAAALGRSRSPKKATASRENGKKGGRPKNK